ncbi:MAG: toll/interleukin-1 receptor domain-containing protein [Castellaniella sp.]|nr:toll/interleukin-1 receptor domain-containing protein [Castellaniella sp.]
MFIDLRVIDFRSGLLRWNADQVKSYSRRGNEILVKLEEYLLDKEKILDASLIERSIFPTQDVDVFISHSHKDRDEAIKLALSFESRGLRVFVDSCVWGYADELLKAIDNKFCIPTGWKNYSYPLRNRTTANVYMILNSALHGMIDNAELLIFLDSENSVRVEDYVNDDEYLSSPWIFSELMFAGRVRRKPRRKIVRAEESISFDSVTASKKAEAEFVYSVPKLSYSIEFDHLVAWLREDGSSKSPVKSVRGLLHLDRLYRRLDVPAALLDDPRVEL